MVAPPSHAGMTIRVRLFDGAVPARQVGPGPEAHILWAWALAGVLLAGGQPGIRFGFRCRTAQGRVIWAVFMANLQAYDIKLSSPL